MHRRMFVQLSPGKVTGGANMPRGHVRGVNVVVALSTPLPLRTVPGGSCMVPCLVMMAEAQQEERDQSYRPDKCGADKPDSELNVSSERRHPPLNITETPIPMTR